MTWWLGAQVAGNISWYMQGSNGTNGVVTTPGAYNDNQWHHVVAARDGVSARNYLYVDGILQNPGGFLLTGFGTLASSNPITIGNLLYIGDSQFHMSGAIDEVAIYNKVLDETTEIIPHFNNIDQYQIGYCDGDEPIFLTEPVTKATVGQFYIYDVDASGNSKPTYSLIEKPSGMIIDSNTGVITWTPVSQSANGRVVVRATNDKESVDQVFNIFLADAPVCRPNLLAYWDFNLAGSAGYVDHIAGWELTGEAPSTTNGISGSGLAFDGINDSLNLSDDLGGVNIFFDFHDVPTFSFEVWMKSDASPSQTMVLVGREQPTNSTQYWLGVQTDGSVGFRLQDYLHTNPNIGMVEGGSVLDGNWHHIVASYNASSEAMQLYVDKVLVDETTQNFLDFGGWADLNIGHLNTTQDQFWYEGSIDELAFYNTALNLTQITDSYNNAMAGNGACIYNYAPVVLSSPDLTVKQDSLYSYDFITMDINEGDVLTLSVINAPAWLSDFVYIPGDSTAVISGTPSDSDVGISNVTLRVSDGTVNVDQEFQIEVINVNDPPEFSSDPPLTVDQDVKYSYTLLATDSDNDELTYSAPQIPLWLTLQDDILSGTPSNDDVGVHSVTLSVTDGVFVTDQEFELTVINVNDPPVVTSEPITEIRAGDSYLYQIDVLDPDPDDELTFVEESIPAWLTLTPASTFALLSGTPQMTDVGAHVVVIKISDGIEEEALAFSINVLDPTAIEDADYLVNKVYPIPTSSKVYFEFSELGDVYLKLIDMTGSVIKEVQFKNTDKMTIDISDLAQSIYFYSVTINDKTSVGQIIKE